MARSEAAAHGPEAATIRPRSAAARALVAVALAVSGSSVGCNLIFGIDPGEAAEASTSTSTGSGGAPATSSSSSSGTGGTAGSGGSGGTGGMGGCAPASCTAGRCPIEELTPGYANETKGMVVTTDRVLWANEVGIAFVQKTGGAPGTLSGTAGFGSTIWVALADGQLSWANYSDGVVRGISVEPPSSSPIVIADVPPQSGNPVQAQYGRIAAFGGMAYWATQEPNAIWRAKADGTAPFEKVADTGWPFGVAVDATHVYWADGLAFQIMRKAVASIGDAAEAFASTNGRPTEISLSGGELFWVTDGGAVQSKKTSAAPSAQPHTYTVDTMVVSKSIIADETFVYWTVYNNDHEGGQGEVRRAHRGGGDMVTLATGQPYFFEITEDCGHLYWNVNNLNDGNPGTVFRMPKSTD